MFRSLGHGGQEYFRKCHDSGIRPRNQICTVRSYSYHVWNCWELVLLSSSVLRETAIMASRILQDECGHWISYKWFCSCCWKYWSMKLKISRIDCNIPACFREREREKVAIVLSAWAWLYISHFDRTTIEFCASFAKGPDEKSLGQKMILWAEHFTCKQTTVDRNLDRNLKRCYTFRLYIIHHNTVHGRNPARVDMVNIPLFTTDFNNIQTVVGNGISEPSAVCHNH